MIIARAYKTELNPNDKQSTIFEGACGTTRFVYNWALDYWILEMDRDLNAAINIRNYYTLKHSEMNACGDEGKTSRVPLAASLKQEVSSTV